MDDARAGAAHGAVIEEIRVGVVTIVRRYGCIRRDHYEFHCSAPLAEGLRARLAERGAVSGSATLYVVEVPGAYQLTVAPRAGRAVLVPRLSTEPHAQRAAALALALLLAETLTSQTLPATRRGTTHQSSQRRSPCLGRRGLGTGGSGTRRA